jgi:hypothetical protein
VSALRSAPRRRPEGVVDGLEAVQVDERHGDRLAAALGPVEGVLEPVEEQCPVGEAGERVVEREVVQLHLALLDRAGELLVLPHRDVLAREHEQHQRRDAGDLHAVEARTARGFQCDQYGGGREREVGEEPGADRLARCGGAVQLGVGPAAHERAGDAEQAERDPPSPLDDRAGDVAAHRDLVGERRVGCGHREYARAEQPPAQRRVPGLGQGQDRDGQQHGVRHGIGDRHGGVQQRVAGAADHPVQHRHPRDQPHGTADEERVEDAARRGEAGAGWGEEGQPHQRRRGKAQVAHVGEGRVRRGDVEHVLVHRPGRLARRPEPARDGERRPAAADPPSGAPGRAHAAEPTRDGEDEHADVGHHLPRGPVEHGAEPTERQQSHRGGRGGGHAARAVRSAQQARREAHRRPFRPDLLTSEDAQ